MGRPAVFDCLNVLKGGRPRLILEGIARQQAHLEQVLIFLIVSLVCTGFAHANIGAQFTAQVEVGVHVEAHFQFLPHLV